VHVGDLRRSFELKTLEGGDVYPRVGFFFIVIGSARFGTTARVTAADIPASNGVVYIIDQVLTSPGGNHPSF